MKTLVTGAAGYIGTHLVEKMKEAGGAFVPTGVCDLQFGSHDFTTIAGQEYDFVVHLAADASIIRSIENPNGVLDNNGFKLIPFLKNNRIGKLVFMSTGGAIYGERTTPAKEEEATWAGIVSPYAQSKYIGEQIIRAMQPNHVILRLGNVFGGNDEIRKEPSALTCFKHDDPIVVYGGKQTRDFVSVYTVCNAIIRSLLFEHVRGTFNIGTGKTSVIGEIAKTYGKERSVNVLYRPMRTAEINDVALDVSKAIKAGILDHFPVL